MKKNRNAKEQEKKIPKTQEVLKKLTSEIVALSNDLNEIESTSTGKAYEIGKRLLELKPILKENRITEKKHFQSNFPWLTAKSLQNYKSLALIPELSEHRQLLCLGVDRLLKIKRITASNNESLTNYFSSNGISFDFENEDKDATKRFKFEVTKLISKTISNRHGKKPSSEHIKKIAMNASSILKSAENITEISPADGPDILAEAITNLNNALNKLNELVGSF
jgi:hypothetical protein